MAQACLCWWQSSLGPSHECRLPSGEAATFAADLEASAPFAVGLALTSGGNDLLAQLGFRARPSSAWLLQMGGVPMAEGLDRLASTRGVAARTALVRDELFPSAEFMRWSSALARRSRRGLAAAYVLRAWRLGFAAGPAAKAWFEVYRRMRQTR